MHSGRIIWTCGCPAIGSAGRVLARGFTLVEMLISVGILVILMTITVSLVNFSNESERIRASSRQIQSYLEGARNRAIYAQQPRGVRLIRDENDPSTVIGLVFIGAPEKAQGNVSVFNGGTTFIEDSYDEDSNGNGALDPGEDRNGNGTLDRAIRWRDLVLRDLLRTGTRIQIPADSGVKYTVTAIGTEDINNNGSLDPGEDINGNGLIDDALTIARPHLDFRNVIDTQLQPISYKMELAPALLPGEEAVMLAERIVIDLDYGKYPESWSAPGTHLDIMFSPRGTVTGPTAATGVIFFLLADLIDTARNLPATNVDADGDGMLSENEINEGEKLLVTLFTRTGHISRSVVYANEDINLNGTLDAGEDGNGNGVLDVHAPFYYAASGEASE